MASEYVNGRISISFSPELDYIAVTRGDGNITIWDTNGELHKTLRSLESVILREKCTMKWLPLDEELEQKPKPKRKPVKSRKAEKKRKRDEKKLVVQHLGEELIVEKRKACGLLVVGTVGGGFVALNVTSSKLKWKVEGCHPRGIFALSYDAKNFHIYSSGEDGKVCVIDSRTGKLIKSFIASTKAISSLTVSPDGNLLATISDDQVKIFDCADSELKFTKTFTNSVSTCTFTEDGSYVLSSIVGENVISVWNASNGAACLSFTLEQPPVLVDTWGEESGKKLYVMAVTERGLSYHWNVLNLQEEPTKVLLVHEALPHTISIFTAKRVKFVKPGYDLVHTLTVSYSDSPSKLYFREMRFRELVFPRSSKKFSWEIENGFILPEILFQLKDVCWAIALIAQLEAALKLAGILEYEQTLSVQSLIDQVPKNNLEENGAIITLEEAGDILREKGVLLDKDCKLDYLLGRADRVPKDLSSKTTFKVARMTYFSIEDRTIDDDDVADEDSDDESKNIHIGLHPVAFEKRLERLLETDGPIAVEIASVPSYINLKKNEIFNPTDNEVKGSKPGHLMLLIGKDVDEFGNHYWIFQDSYGKKNWGEDGKIRVMRYRGIVRLFTKITLPRRT